MYVLLCMCVCIETRTTAVALVSGVQQWPDAKPPAVSCTHLPESAQHKQHRAQACIKRRCSTYTHVICVYAGRPQHPTHLNDLDDLHGEDALSSARGALLGMRVDPLRRAGLRHAVEEPPLRPDIDIDIVIVIVMAS